MTIVELLRTIGVRNGDNFDKPFNRGSRGDHHPRVFSGASQSLSQGRSLIPFYSSGCHTGDCRAMLDVCLFSWASTSPGAGGAGGAADAGGRPSHFASIR